MSRDRISQAKGREALVDLAVHLVALIAATAGCAVLVAIAVSGHRPAVVIGVGLYVFGLLATLACSALANWWTPSPLKEFLRRCDHSMIFLLIAGTYSPFMAGALDSDTIAVVYAGVWAVALVGLVARLALPNRFERLFVALYLVLGWCGVLALGPLSERLSSQVLALIVAGGVLYSVGVAFYVRRPFPYQDATWHGFVVTAAACHYVAIFCHLAP